MSLRESIDPKSSLWAWLAFDLWLYRTKRGLSLAQVGQIAKVARGTVSNWEAGRLRPREEYLVRLDKAWDTGGHFQRLLWYARTGHDPDWFKQYVQYEQQADIIKIYNGKAIPLLLQTPAYAQAILWAAGRTREVEAESSARMKRQEILSRQAPPYVWALLDQEVLESPLGGPAVMREQLNHLIEVGRMQRVSIRIVPRSVGWHPGQDGAFQILKIGSETGFREVAYAAAQIGGRLIEAGHEVSTLTIRFDQIGAIALSERESRDLIDRTMRAYDDGVA